MNGDADFVFNYSVRDVTACLRGGAIERVDFHPDCDKRTAGIYFVLANDAARFIRETRRVLGHWAVDAIPRHKGGHETIKLNVGSSIANEGATRIIRVAHLPPMWSVAELEKVVRGQSSSVRVEIEDIKTVSFDAVEISVGFCPTLYPVVLLLEIWSDMVMMCIDGQYWYRSRGPSQYEKATSLRQMYL